jgi:hypothetical protein
MIVNFDMSMPVFKDTNPRSSAAYQSLLLQVPPLIAAMAVSGSSGQFGSGESSGGAVTLLGNW